MRLEESVVIWSLSPSGMSLFKHLPMSWTWVDKMSLSNKVVVGSRLLYLLYRQVYLRFWASSSRVWRSPGTWSGRWCETRSVLVRLGETRRDLRQREGGDWSCRVWSRREVRDGAQTVDIQRRLALKVPVPVFRSRGDMRRHKTVWDGEPGLMTQSPEWGDTAVMMTRGVSVPVCPRSCENAEVIFKRVASTFNF